MLTVCLGAYTLRYLQGGAYMWMFLNWALGLRSLGCRVVWLDSVPPDAPTDRVRADATELRRRLAPYGLAKDLAVINRSDGSPPVGLEDVLDLEAAAEADLFIDLGYDLDDSVVKRFRRSAFVDIDPGFTQTWLSLGQLDVAAHDIYFTVGETVGQPESLIPGCGLRWLYTPPPVFLPAWPVVPAPDGAAYTTVSSWWDDLGWLEFGGTLVDNSKRGAFLPYVELPSHTTARLELALPLTGEDDATDDRSLFTRNGWSIRQASEVSSTPEAHRAYIQGSRGEFSCMKRGYSLLETAWTSERTLNYLASGKPAVVEYTGHSRFLPDAEGLFRFRSLDEAARCLASAERDYERHARAARALAVEHFDATKVLTRVLDRVVK